MFNKSKQTVELFYKKNTNEIDNRFQKLLENNIGYMSHNYNTADLLFNQNYLVDNDILSDNLYDWPTICNFLHHNILDPNIYKTLQKRCERFIHVLSKYSETTTFLYITKINTCASIASYMSNIVELKKKYGMECYLIIIINCDNM